MKKRNLWILSTLALCASGLPAPAVDAPAVLGALEIRGLDHLAASAFELTKAAGNPVPKEMISMVLYRALGTMSGMGIPAEGTVRAIAFDNGSEKGGFAVLLPVENGGAEYLSSLGQSGWKNASETADELLHFIAPPDSGAAWSEVYFLKRGATLLAARTATDVRLADAARSALPAILPAEGDVAVQIYPAALAETFGPQIAEQMDKAFNNPGMPQNSAALGQLYAKSYLAAARMVDACALGLGVADGNLNVHTRLAPVAGTALAAWMATVKSPSAATAVVALPDALAAETMNLGDLGLLAPAYFRFVEETMQAMPTGLDAETLRRYLENEKACFAQLTGDLGIALFPPTKEQPLRLAEYAGLKDASVIRARMPEMVQAANAMFQAMAAAETNAPMPFEMRSALGEPRRYREIDVDRFTYSIAPGKVLAAIWPPAIPTRLDLELAWVPGGVLVAVGDSSLTEALVDRALDGGAVPLTDLPAWKSAYPMPERNLIDVSHVALFDLVRAYLALGDSLTGGSNAQWVPATSGNLESASYAMEGLMSRFRFRLADVEAVGLKIQEARQKAMDEMMKQMQSQRQRSMDGDAIEDDAPVADDEPASLEPEEAPAPAAEPAPAE